MSRRIIVGDALVELRKLPDDSVNCVVTSPPYWGLRDYKMPGQVGLEETPAEYVDKVVVLFRDVRRVLRDDGTLWLNLGDSYAGSWGAQGRDGAMATLSVVSARQIDAHPHKASLTGSLSKTPGLKAKDLVGIPWRVALALQADGWWLRSDIIWAKPNPMPESVTDRPTKSHEYVFLLTKSERYFYDADAIREKDGGRAAGNREGFKGRQGGAEFHAVDGGVGSDGWKVGTGRNKRSVWTIATRPNPEAHFATFPEDLVTPCVLAGCPLGGVVLDPFGGTGTVARVAEDLGRRWVLIELNPDYAAMAERRMRQHGLFVAPGAA